MTPNQSMTIKLLVATKVYVKNHIQNEQNRIIYERAMNTITNKVQVSESGSSLYEVREMYAEYKGLTNLKKEDKYVEMAFEQATDIADSISKRFQ